MRLLIISDIHANLTAFEAVLADAKGLWDKIWCLGDVIGYGPDPNECVELLRQFDHLSLSGNHDWAVLGKLDINTFNNDAREAIDWTREALTAENRAYLESLPALTLEEPFTLAHASPRHPVWEYILDPATAGANFAHYQTPYCLVGHTHSPIIFAELENEYPLALLPEYNRQIALGVERLIINPGSVGQPRDSDPRAAYALLDTDTLLWQFRRVEYAIGEVQARMRQHDLPNRLVVRLEYGW